MPGRLATSTALATCLPFAHSNISLGDADPVRAVKWKSSMWTRPEPAPAPDDEELLVSPHEKAITLLIEVFGEAGRAARSAVGMAELPFDICVEIEAIVQVRH